ncbi:hypothetical protein IAR50_002638 [Cryptococcus sp. DSM 104548]
MMKHDSPSTAKDIPVLRKPNPLERRAISPLKTALQEMLEDDPVSLERDRMRPFEKRRRDLESLEAERAELETEIKAYKVLCLRFRAQVSAQHEVILDVVVDEADEEYEEYIPPRLSSGIQTVATVGLGEAAQDAADSSPEATEVGHSPLPYRTLTLNVPAPFAGSSTDLDAIPTPRTLTPSLSHDLPLRNDYDKSDASEGTQLPKRSREMVLVMKTETDRMKPPRVLMDGSSLLLGGFMPYDYHIITF